MHRFKTGFIHFIIICIICPYSVFGQSEIKPGGIHIAPSGFLKDTGAIIQQIKRADALTESQPDSSVMLTNQAIESSKWLGFKFGVAYGLHQAGMLKMQKSEYLPAIAIFKYAIEWCNPTPSSRDAELLISLLGNLASAYSYLGKADSTAWYSYQALSQTEKLKIVNPATLLHIYTKMLRLWISMNEDGANLINDKYIQYAIDYLTKAEQIGNISKSMMAKIVFSKGQLKEMSKDYDSARFFYKKYLDLLEQGAVRKGRVLSWKSAMLLNVSNTFNMQNMPDSAIRYAKEAVKDFQADNQEDQVQYKITSEYHIGKALFLKHQYQDAINKVLETLRLSQQKNIFFMRETAYEILATAYEKTGDFKSSLHYKNAYTIIKDSIRNVSKIQSILQMEMRYQVAEKNQQLAEQKLAIVNRDNKIKAKNNLIIAISSGLVLVLLLGILFYNRIKHQQQLKKLETTRQLEVARLQATIDGEENERRRLASELHDGIGGELGSLKLRLDTALKNNRVEDSNHDFEEILAHLDNTYKELRQTAHNLMPEILINEGFLKAVEVFCANVSGSSDIDINFDTVGAIPQFSKSDELFLYRILQELLHNVVKHAGASEVFVQMAYTNNLFGMTIEDNGKGFDVALAKEKNIKALGLFSIQRRIRSLGGNIDIVSEKGRGTSINIELHIKPEMK